MSKKIIILGGYGNTGIKIADLLLKESEVEVILAARNMERLTTSCRELNEKYHTDRVSVVHADASHRDSLLHAFKGSDMVVVASGTAEYVRMVAGAVLEAGIDYLDIHYSTKKLNILFSMAMEKPQHQTGGICHESRPSEKATFKTEQDRRTGIKGQGGFREKRAGTPQCYPGLLSQTVSRRRKSHN